MYAKGEGVPRDYAQALIWLRKAADRGNALAQAYLGAMYAKGEGAPQDYAQAHRWFNLAASRAEDPATHYRAAMRRDALADEMTPAQIADALRLPRECKPK